MTTSEQVYISELLEPGSKIDKHYNVERICEALEKMDNDREKRNELLNIKKQDK